MLRDLLVQFITLSEVKIVKTYCTELSQKLYISSQEYRTLCIVSIDTTDTLSLEQLVSRETLSLVTRIAFSDL